MTKIITSKETDIELDPESLTDNLDINKPIFESKSKMLEAIRDLDYLLDNATNQIQNTTGMSDAEVRSSNKRDCYIRVKSKNSNNQFSMNFKLIGLNQGIIERNVSEIEIEASEQKLIKFFAFYQSNIASKKRTKKLGLNNLTTLLKTRFKNRQRPQKRKRKVVHKNDVYIINLSVNLDGKKINLIDIDSGLWRISEMRYAFDNNRSTCKVSLTRTH